LLYSFEFDPSGPPRLRNRHAARNKPIDDHFKARTNLFIQVVLYAAAAEEAIEQACDPAEQDTLLSVRFQHPVYRRGHRVPVALLLNELTAATSGELAVMRAAIVFRGSAFSLDPTALFRAAEGWKEGTGFDYGRAAGDLIDPRANAGRMGASSSAGKISTLGAPYRMSIANLPSIT
jgi:hypothetical protein